MAEKFAKEELETRVKDLEKEVERLKSIEETLSESEQRYRELFDNSLVGISQALPNGRLIAANQAYARMYGYESPEEMMTEVTDVGKQLYANSDDRKMVLQELSDKGILQAREFTATRRDGTRFFVMVTAREIRDADGKLLCYQATHLDITNRRKMEETLKEISLYTRNLIEASPDPLVTISPEGKIMDVNAATEEVTGVFRENLIDSDFSIYFTEPDKAREGYRQAYSEGTVKDYPLSIRHVSGRIIDVLYNASVFRNEDGEVLGVFAAARDITMRKQIEEQLRLSESHYRDLFENSGTSITIIDKHGKYLFVNRTAAIVYGKPQEEIIGKSMFDFLPEATARKYLEANLNLIKRGGHYEYEDTFMLTSGEKIFRIVDRCLKDKEGHNFAIQSSAVDITDRVMAEKQREIMQAELFQAQKMESLGTLVAGVAHEINNPINTIMNNTPLLQRIWKDVQPVIEKHMEVNPNRRYGGLSYEFLKENLDQLISDIDMSANRVADIVKGLKDFSRKTNSSEKQLANLNIAVENAVRLANSSLQKSGIVLVVDLETGLPSITANLQNLEQIILNLVVNAIQAIDHDHGQIKIATSYKKKTGTVVLSVGDNGKGIDPGISDKIFDPFFTGRQKEGGTGLGLAITQSLVKTNNGRISFNSGKNKGSLFSVSFMTRPGTEPARILLVDDDKGILKVMEKVLKIDSDYILEKASDGNEALIKMGIFHPDLLVLDIFMPQMDGVEVVRTIKNQPELDQMKIIILSGYTEHEKIKQVAEMGVFKILAKPMNAKELLETVEAGLKERVA